MSIPGPQFSGSTDIKVGTKTAPTQVFDDKSNDTFYKGRVNRRRYLQWLKTILIALLHDAYRQQSSRGRISTVFTAQDCLPWTPNKRQQTPDCGLSSQCVGLALKVEKALINSTRVNNANRLIGSIIEQAIFGNEEACTPKSISMADSTLSSLHRHLNNFEWCTQIRLIVGKHAFLLTGTCVANVVSSTNNSPRATKRRHRLPTCTPAPKAIRASEVTDTSVLQCDVATRLPMLTLQREDCRNASRSSSSMRQSGMVPKRQIKHINNNNNSDKDNISGGLTLFRPQACHRSSGRHGHLSSARTLVRHTEAVSGR